MKTGSLTITSTTCTQRWATNPLGSLHESTATATGLRSWLLDSRGALQPFAFIKNDADSAKFWRGLNSKGLINDAIVLTGSKRNSRKRNIAGANAPAAVSIIQRLIIHQSRPYTTEPTCTNVPVMNREMEMGKGGIPCIVRKSETRALSYEHEATQQNAKGPARCKYLERYFGGPGDFARPVGEIPWACMD